MQVNSRLRVVKFTWPAGADLTAMCSIAFWRLTCKVNLQKLLHELWVCLVLEGPELVGRMPYRLSCKLLVYRDKGTVVNGADGKAALIKGLDIQDDGSWSLHTTLYSVMNQGILSNACMSFLTPATNQLNWSFATVCSACA